MKKIKFFSAFILVFGLILVADSKDNKFVGNVQTAEEIEEVIAMNEMNEVCEDVEPQENANMLRPNPCYPSPFVILPNVNSQAHCYIWFGTIWYNGKCYWCW